MSKKPRKRPNYLIIISAVLILGFVLWNYRSSWLISRLSFDTVCQGWVKHEKQVKVLFANTEIVLTAPTEGKVTAVQEDGRRFKKGETVAKLTPVGVTHGSPLEEVSVAAPISGLFYSHRDGLEEVVTPENLMNMDLEGLLTQVNNTKPPAENVDNPVSKHTPMGKMLNNLYPSWMFAYLEASDTVAKDDVVKFMVDGEEYAGTVMKVSGKPQGAVVRFTQYVKGTSENRVKDAVWIYKPSSKGLVVPTSSLCTFGEERGVYTGEDGVIRFRNVKVVDSNENLACVVGVPEGVQVVVNPRKGIEGLPLR